MDHGMQMFSLVDLLKKDIGAKFWVTAIVISDTLSVGQINYPSEAKFSTKPIQLMRKYSDTNNLDPTTDKSDYTQVIVAIIGTIGLIVVAFISSLIGRARSQVSLFKCSLIY